MATTNEAINEVTTNETEIVEKKSFVSNAKDGAVKFYKKHAGVVKTAAIGLVLGIGAVVTYKLCEPALADFMPDEDEETESSDDAEIIEVEAVEDTSEEVPF